MWFIITTGIVLIINIVFLIGSLVYTVKVNTKGKGTPRISLAPSILSSQLNPRLSIQPQVTIYQAIVRLSSVPHDLQNLEEKTYEETKKQEAA